MKTLKITKAIVSPTPAVGGFAIDVSVRYGTSGVFSPVATNVHVNQDGTLPVPISFSIDETINPTVQTRTVYNGCPASPPYFESYTTF
jgi:hypothetical protein